MCGTTNVKVKPPDPRTFHHLYHRAVVPGWLYHRKPKHFRAT
jgi:hypothetical protein